jgi:methylated-DNA-[protein]-cysteine S-methyltransferase
MRREMRSKRGARANDGVYGLESGRALFDTPLGRCGIAWSPRGITRFDLPGHGVGMEEKSPSEAPLWVREAMDRITLHLGGNPQDLSGIPIDMAGIPPFFRRVYEVTRGIPAGETLSYAELADRAGSPRAFRAVGQAMAKNPFPVVVPCHRVLAAGGKLGGFSAPGGTATKVRLLDLER